MSSQNYRLDELRAHTTYIKLMLSGAFSFTRLLITYLNDVKRLRFTKEGEVHYIRPPRLYDLPEYLPEMQVRISNKKYFRPTRFCNPNAPEVIAVANTLGAYRLSEEDYVQSVFEFVKEKVLLEFLPIDGVEATLRRGTGTCFHLISVFIALCRTAGIPARYKMYSTYLIQSMREVFIDSDPMVKKWYDTLGYFMIEGEGEVFLKGQWVVAHVGNTSEREAAAGIPISRLGEDAIGVWLFARLGTIMLFESIPLGLNFGTQLLQRIAPGSMERINVSVLKHSERGRQVLEAAGGVEAYDNAVRSKLGPKSPKVDLSTRPEIVFGRK